MIGNTGYDPEREIEFATAFAEVGIDGLVIIGAANAQATATLCRQERIPVVWMHSVRDDVNLEIVGVDHVRAGELVTRHLIDEHQCSDIAFVGGFTEADVRHGDREAVQQRYGGATAALGTDMPLIRTDLTPAGAYAAVTTFLAERDSPPEAVVVGTYGQAAATVRAIFDAGLVAPTDVRVVGFDGSGSDYGQVRLTAAQQPVDAIAQLALGRLLDEAQQPGGSLLPSLRIGTSCGCA
jgi:LacI family transcriptional regulator